MRFMLRIGIAPLLVGLLAVLGIPVSSATASGLFGQTRYAAIVVDASDGEVLYSKRADALRYPASITKIMTLYLTFEALSTGRLHPSDRVMVSAHAASMIPSKTNLRPGDSLTVDDAIKVVAVHSANDIAVALAEKIGGSEGRFASLMTLRAQELGMANTRFVNANGVPDPRQITTARDIAILSRAVMRDYPQYYSYFGVRSFSLRGQIFTNHNHLLREPGYDGFKTGFTNAAGYNLSASAVRNGRRLITVVLGGSSGAARDENVQTLMNAGFDVLRRRALGERTTIAANIAEPDDSGPIERPSVEQGDGADSGLSVELNDPARGEHRIDQLAAEEQKQAIPVIAAPVARGVRHARLECSSHYRRRRSPCQATSEPSAAARSARAAPCDSLHGRALHRCRRSEAKIQMARTTPRRHHVRRRRQNA